MPASRQINNQKSNRLITQAALERASETITDWWEGAFLAGDADSRSQFFVEAGQTLPLLIESPSPSDVIDAMKVHRIRLAKDQGLQSWEPVLAARPGGVCAGSADLKRPFIYCAPSFRLCLRG
jgi:hypothetical protein